MRYKIGKNPVYRAPVPALIGGLNTASSSDVVGDNQLSNCLNMMAMDGILRTRPGFVINNNAGVVTLQSTAENIKIYDFSKEDREKVIDRILKTDYQKIKTEMLKQLDEFIK